MKDETDNSQAKLSECGVQATQSADATLRLTPSLNLNLNPSRTLKVRTLRLIRDLEADLVLLQFYAPRVGVMVQGIEEVLEGLHAARHALEAGRKPARKEG